MHSEREQASGPLDDGSGVPKHPGMQGYNAASECTDNMCEEGMHIGGFYQPGGRGYTGQFFHGVIDELVPIAQADTLHAKLDELGIPNYYDRVEGWPHSMDRVQGVNDRCRFIMEKFLAKHVPLPN